MRAQGETLALALFRGLHASRGASRGVRRLAEHSFPARTLRHLPDGDACAPRMTEPPSTVGASEKRVAAAPRLFLSGLDGGDGDGVNDVLDERAAGEIVDRAAQALEHGTDADHIGAALHSLVGRVSRVQIGENEDGGPARDRAARRLGAATSAIAAASY